MSRIAIRVNGETVETVNGCRVDGLLRQLALADRKVAVEINREIVPRSDYASRILQDGDQLEIVQAIGGG